MLEDLRRRLGVDGGIMIVRRGLQKLDIARKKKTRQATERDRPEVQRRRSFRREVETIESERLVSVDETGVTTAMTPAYGRAARGERVEASWESVTAITAPGPDGVRAPLASPGSTDAATSLSDVEGVPVPALRRGMWWSSTT
jgi:hypothetical protein